MTSFYFYDLETSGLNARDDRIMQFAGQRTTMDLEPIGEPHNVLVKLNDDTLPSPEAVMVTGITPQSTQSEGLTEAEFAQFLKNDVFTEDTITVGFNNIRFDDEFIRHLFWRNFHDAYDWSWRDGRSRWDMLDVVRMTRAIRPDGIEWPVDSNGKSTNRLELLTVQNGITHENAHDALADVEALISIAKLIREKQPKLYEYLLGMKDKKSVQRLVNLEQPQPFVYVSGRYDVAYEKATVAYPLTTAPNRNCMVYDLRHDPTPFLSLSEDKLRARLFAKWEDRSKDGFVAIPVKQLQYNHCPAVAPLGVLEQGDGWSRLSIDSETIVKHKNILLQNPVFAENIRSVFEHREGFAKQPNAEGQLYDGFISSGKDTMRMELVRNASVRELTDLHPEFQDERLVELLLRYKARSFPKSLTEDEQSTWEAWRAERLQQQLPLYVKSLQKIAKTSSDESVQFLVQELQLWAENIIPAPEV